MFPYLRTCIAALAGLGLAVAALNAVPQSDGLYAEFDTTEGVFTVRLAYDAVPLTVGNFVGLAEGRIPHIDTETGLPTTKPFFDGLPFFLAIKDFVVASGDPNGHDPLNNEIAHDPGYTFADEMHPELGHGQPGAVGMYNTGLPNTNGSRFYITLDSATQLDGFNSVFGFVIEGLDVVEAISAVAVDDDDIPMGEVAIHKVTIHRVGEDAKAFRIDDSFKIPQLRPLDLSLGSDLTASIPFFKDADVIFETSQDLANWSEQVLSEDADGTLPVDLKTLLEEGKPGAFARAGRVDVPAIGQFKPGATFKATILGAQGSFVAWNYNLGEDGGGTASIGNNGGNIVDYRWFDLPIGAQVIIQTDNNNIIAYYLRFTSVQEQINGDTRTITRTGGTFAHVRVIGSNGATIRRTNTTGTFELVETEPVAP